MKPRRFLAPLYATLLLILGIGAFPSQVFAQTWPLPDGTLIKASGPEVDRMQSGYRRWIPNPTTFSCMGLDWNMVQTIPDSIWREIPAGRAYPSRTNGTLLQGSSPAVYVMDNCQRRWIPDAATFDADGYKWSDIQHIADADLQAIPQGAPLPKVQDILTANRYQQVGQNFYMRTQVRVVKHSGQINATTHTWDENAFWGFTGGVQIWLLDKNGSIIATTTPRTFAVTSPDRNVARSDRTDRWLAWVDPGIAARTTQVQVVQYLYQMNWPGTNKSAAQTIVSTVCVAFPGAAQCTK